MAANQRLGQIQKHLSGNFPGGMLKGETAVITGAGQGIGAECARIFANEGARVVVADIDKDKAEAVAKAINESGGIAVAVAGDVQSQEYTDRLVKAAADLGGDGKIHHIVTNAGFTWDGVIHKMTDEQWESMLAIHNTAPFKLIRAAAPYFRLKDGENRTIVNVSSTTGYHGNAGQVNYSVAKAGQIGMTKTIAKEWSRYGVRANTVTFGYIKTRLTAAKEDGAYVMHEGKKVAIGIPGGGDGGDRVKDIPLGRAGTPTEAAMAVLTLASPLTGYITGHNLMVTGGRGM